MRNTILSIVSTMVILTGVGLNPGLGAEKTKIAAIFGKTGPAVKSDIAHLNAIQLAVEEINQKGGVLGKMVELIEFDHKSTSLGARFAAKEALKHNVIGVIGSCWSAHSQAIADVLQEARVPMITPSSTNPGITLTGDYIFRACFIDTFQGIVMAEFAVKDLQSKTAAILTNVSTRYSTDLSDYFEKTFTGLGGEIVFKENYLQETTDFSKTISELNSVKPDVVYLPGYWRDVTQIVSQARKMGFTKIFLGSDTWNTAVTIKGAILGEHYYTDHWHASKIDPQNNLFKNYQSRYGKIYTAGSLLAYDATLLFVDAVNRAKSLKPDAIRQAIHDTKGFQGITGKISFNENGDPIKPAYIIRFENNRKKLVKIFEPQL